MTKKEHKAAEVAANKYTAYAKKVRALAGWVKVPELSIHFSYDAGNTAEDAALNHVSIQPVGFAVWPLKVAAVQAAGKNAREEIDRMIITLKNAHWNLDTVAPYPSCIEPDFMRRAKREVRNRYLNLFTITTARSVGESNSPTYASRNSGYEARYISQAEEGAAYQYNLFVLKLVNKIGDGAVSATLEGDHVWSYSILTVTMKDKTVQRWKTQQIENRSKLGLWFPQWPSRLMKGK